MVNKSFFYSIILIILTFFQYFPLIQSKSRYNRSIQVQRNVHSNRDILMESCYIADLKRFKEIVYRDDSLASNFPIFYNMAENDSGRTCMMLCGSDPQEKQDVVDQNCLEILQILEEKGQEIISKNQQENSLENPSQNAANIIGVHYQYVDDYNWDILMFSIAKNFTRVSSYLLDNDMYTSGLKTKDSHLNYLILAGNYGNVNIITKLLMKKDIKILEKDQNTFTFLQYLLNYCKLYNNKQILYDILQIDRLKRKLNKFLDQDENNLVFYILFYTNYTYSFYTNALEASSIASQENLSQIRHRKIFNKELIEILLDAGVNPLHLNKNNKKVSELIDVKDDEDQEVKNLLLEYEARETERRHQHWLDHQNLEF